MSSAREEILRRVRAALEPAAPPGRVPRAYRRAGEHRPGSPALLDLLAERLVDYRATVHRTSADDLVPTIHRVLADLVSGGARVSGGGVPGGARVVVPPGLPEGWAPPDAVLDGGLSTNELDEAGAVLTACAAAAAETGTLVLDGSAGQGRRAVSLVPDRHVCVVRADQVVQNIPELLGRLDPHRPLTFISGPSATSDIELHRVEGVHGPRTLVVVLVS